MFENETDDTDVNVEESHSSEIEEENTDDNTDIDTDTEEKKDEETTDKEESDKEESEEKEDEDKEKKEEPEDDQKEHKKATANDRIRQLVTEKNELKDKVVQLEEKFNTEHKAKQQDAEIPFVDVDPEKFKSKVSSLSEEIDDLKLDGKTFEAAQKQRELNKLYDSFDANEDARKKWESQRDNKLSSEQNFKKKMTHIEDAAEFFRKESKISEDVWVKSSKWFADKCRADPILGREFTERMENSPMSGIQFAHNYTVKNMGKAAQAVKQVKEKAKNKLISSGQTTGKAVSVKNFDDLWKLSDKGIDQYIKDNPAKYKKIMDSRLK